MSAKVRESVSLKPLETVHSLRQHQCQRELARTFGSGEDQGLGKVPTAHTLAQVPNRRFIAMEIAESHPSSLRHP